MIVTYCGHHSGYNCWRCIAYRPRPYKNFVPDYFWNGISACVWIVPGTVDWETL